MESEEEYYVIMMTKRECDHRNFAYGPFDSEKVKTEFRRRDEMYSEEYDVFISYRMGMRP